MFKKPFKLKSNAPLKGSESKKLRQRLEKSFPQASAEQLQTLVPAKAAISMLKLVTHSEFETSVYCVDKLPMFFEIEGGALVPTLYAMWQVPQLLPYFTTLPLVLKSLSNGANLMLPGVIAQGVGQKMYGHHKKGQLVAVNLTSNKSAVGVGMLPRSSDDLYMCGGHGVAVEMLHVFGDKLWAHEPQLVQQVPNFKPQDLTKNDFPALGEDMRKLKHKNEATEQPTQTQESAVESETDANNLLPIAELSLAATANVDDAADAPEKETPELVLKNAFLAALKKHGKTLQLPLLTSNFYRLYVVMESAQPIDLKKTKYKKLSNFLNEMCEQSFIVVREEAKGIDKITSIDFEHPELINFIADAKPSNAENDAHAKEQALFHSELTELYLVSDATAPFFTKLNYKRGEGIPVAQVKKIVREYISKFNLNKTNPATSAVKLDETLTKICGGCEEANLSQICNYLTTQMQHSYQMCTAKDITTSSKPLIQMSLATRSGNKKVTLVSNVECYGIILSEFIKLCKQGAAASTTIVKLPSQKHEQLQVQGNQVRFIFNLLTETYKVPAKCILGLELAKDGKKHKKK